MVGWSSFQALPGTGDPGTGHDSEQSLGGGFSSSPTCPGDTVTRTVTPSPLWGALYAVRSVEGGSDPGGTRGGLPGSPFAFCPRVLPASSSGSDTRRPCPPRLVELRLCGPAITKPPSTRGPRPATWPAMAARCVTGPGSLRSAPSALRTDRGDSPAPGVCRPRLPADRGAEDSHARGAGNVPEQCLLLATCASTQTSRRGGVGASA